MTAGIFKANDIRGVVGETLDEAVVFRIGRAVAAQAKETGNTHIALGRDGRLSSPALAAALASGLQAGGMEVLDIGLAPTPALYYTAIHYSSGNGAMITGSHNPKNHNGIKMMLGGATVQGKLLYDRYQQLDENISGKREGAIRPLGIGDKYLQAVAVANHSSRHLRVVVDAGNGAAGAYAPALYKQLGHEVIPLFCDIDGNFPNHHPDPSQPENLRDAERVLVDSGADVALLFDGDGDRLGVLLPGKPMIYADRLLMLYARDMLARHVGARVVFDVKCSAHMLPWIETHGGIADMQPTGHAFIKARMKETGALFGGEMSGHFYFAENWCGVDDALFAGARFLALLAENGDIMEDIPDSVSSPELQVDMYGKDQHRFVEDLKTTSKFDGAVRIITIDGLRVEYESGFGLVRASNTTPSLVLRFEAQNEATLGQIKAQFRRVLAAADPSLVLSF